jgi:hypothetical protein
VNGQREARQVVWREFLAAWYKGCQDVQRKPTAKQICSDRFKQAARELATTSNAAYKLSALSGCPL